MFNNKQLNSIEIEVKYGNTLLKTILDELKQLKEANNANNNINNRPKRKYVKKTTKEDKQV